jgi:uncharacterized protein (DUF1697 family)
MAALRALLSDLGYADVATLLNSGNAVFCAANGTPATHARNIAAAISARLNMEVPVTVKSARELAAIVADAPFHLDASAHSRLLVAFAPDRKALSALAVIEPLVVPPEQFAVGTEAAYLFCPAGILESKAGSALVGKAGRSATTRNWATVLKLLALTDARGG